MMKGRVVVFDQYGEAGVLRIEEREARTPGDNEVLVRVKAAAVNPVDWKVRAGEMKFMPGQKFPHMVGSDFAGTAAEVGSGVTQWKVGDAVLGWTNSFSGGAYADYVTVSAAVLVAKPETLSFSEASALPTGSTAALQGLRDVGRARQGMRILIYGCTGGVGMFAVPLAKSMETYVVGYAGPAALDFANTLGADEVYNYKAHDVLSTKEPFDIIFDLSGHLSFENACKILTPHGVYVDPVPNPSVILGSLFFNLFHGQHHGVLMSKLNAHDLQHVLDQIKERGIQIPIGREFPLGDVVSAHQAGEAGTILGKLVLLMD